MGQEEIEKLAEQNTPDIGRGRIEMASTVYVENLRLKFIKGYQKAQEEKQDTEKLLEEVREEAEKLFPDAVYTTSENVFHRLTFEKGAQFIINKLKG
jgi:hypothetical protein